MTSSGSMDSGQLDALAHAFSDQLMACLDECARGRKGLFSDYTDYVDAWPDAEESPWPEAARLRQLALALQCVFRQEGQHNALADEFLDLCSIHGESHPGERKLARAFLERIERGEVGTPTQGEWKP